jgi:hypothetical protein
VGDVMITGGTVSGTANGYGIAPYLVDDVTIDVVTVEIDGGTIDLTPTTLSVAEADGAIATVTVTRSTSRSSTMKMSRPRR